MREIKLSSGLSRYDTNAAFPIGDLELYISNLPTCSGEFRLVAYMNDKKIDTYTLTRDDPRVTVPRDKLAAGVFSCNILHYNGDTLVRRYSVENLLIAEIDDGLLADPEFKAIGENIAKVGKDIATLSSQVAEILSSLKTTTESIESGTKKLNTVAETADNTRGQALAILKWMFEAQNSIPYLNAETVDEFAVSLGVTLSAEEKNYISGGKTE